MKEFPTVDFFGKQVSRLMIGGNPFSGNSHQNHQLNEAMADFFTAKRIKDTLFQCMEEGINTMQVRADAHLVRLIREFRAEGGKLHWIAQPAPEIVPYENNLRTIANNGAFAVYHHGTTTDALFKAGKIDELEYRLKALRQTGLVTGLCSHMPKVFEYAERHHWDVDFYMTCVYNISKVDRVSSAITGTANQGEPFDDEDRAVMYDFVRSTGKPCLVFKILGAGRRCQTQDQVRAAFTEAFHNIKPSDCVIVGMFPKDSDQVAQNAAHVRYALGLE